MLYRTNSICQFAYIGINAQGEIIKGNLQSVNKQTAIQYLQESSIHIIKLRRKLSFQIGKNKIKLTDLWHMSNQLSVILNAAIPILKALSLIKKQCSKTLQPLLEHVIKQAESGHSLSASLKSYQQMLPKFYHTFIEAGESSGHLAQSLTEANQLIWQKIQLHRLLKKALTYPCIILVTSTLIITGMIKFIIPQFQQMYSQMGKQLPMLTKMVIRSFTIIEKIAPTSMLFIFFFIILFMILSKKLVRFKLASQKYTLSIPVIGSYLKLKEYIQWLSLIGSLLNAGIPLKSALIISKEGISFYYFEHSMQQVIEQVEQGKSLSYSLLEAKWMQEEDLSFIRMGEHHGELGRSMQQQSIWLQHNLRNVIEHLTRLLEPLILVILAIIMGGVLIALYLPLFQMGQLF